MPATRIEQASRPKALARLLPVALLLAACAPAARNGSGVDIRTDQFSKVVTLVGRPARSYTGVSVRYMLRSFVPKDPSLPASHQIFAEFFYTGPAKNYDRAADDAARPLRLARIDANLCALQPDCTKSEAVGIEVDAETLRLRARTGYSVKVTARSGDSSILTITPAMLAEQLAALDHVRERAGPGQLNTR